MLPAPAYAASPLALALQRVLRTAYVALCIDQIGPLPQQKLCHLRQDEVLPDVSGVAGVIPMVVPADPSDHSSFSSSLLIHPLGDVEGLRRSGYCYSLRSVVGLSRGSSDGSCSSQELVVYLIGQPAGSSHADQNCPGNC